MTINNSWSQIFEKISDNGEGGHVFLTKLLGYATSPRIYLGVYALITLFFIYKFTTYLKPESVALSMFLYYLLFFSNSFNGMRQYLAVAITTYSFKFIFERKPVKFVLLVLLASTFHTSAFVVLPMYLLWGKNNKPLHWILLLPLLATILFVAINLGSVLDSFSDYEFENARLQIYVYYTDNYDTKNRDIYVHLFTSLVALLHLPRLRALDKRNGFLVILMLIGTILNICGYTSPAAKRIMLYFSIAEIWLLADIPKCYKDHHSVWTARILIILYPIVIFTVTAYFLKQSNLIPYIWYLPGWARI